jgi:hypothetical protein
MNREPRNGREAHFILGGGGVMSPYRLHSQAFRPAPARRLNLYRRVLRAILGALT